MTEFVDILEPPLFVKTGRTKPLNKAWEDGDWIGTFNLWIISSPVNMEPSLVYQQRSLRSSWEPGKLDVTAGGHLEAGETVEKGLREVREELGRNYSFKQLHYLGRRLNVSPDVNGNMRNNVVEICMIIDNAPLDQYILQKSEVSAIFNCPLSELAQLHTEPGFAFTAFGLNADGEKIETRVTENSFPRNWDRYHFKIVLLAQRLLQGEGNLIY